MSPSLDIHRQPIALGSPALAVASDVKSAKLRCESGHLPGGARISVGDGSHGKRAKEACESNRRLLSSLSLCLKSLFEKVFSWLGLRSGAPARLSQPPASSAVSVPPAPPAPAQRRESVQPAPRQPVASMPAPAPSRPAPGEAPPMVCAPIPAAASPLPSAPPPAALPDAPPFTAPAPQPLQLPTQAQLLAQIHKGVSLSPGAPPAAAPIHQDAATQAILARRAQVAGEEDEDQEDDDAFDLTPAPQASSPVAAARAQALAPAPETKPAAVAPENLLNAIQQGVKLRSGTPQMPPASETPKTSPRLSPLAGLPQAVQERLQRQPPAQDSNQTDDWDA